MSHPSVASRASTFRQAKFLTQGLEVRWGSRLVFVVVAAAFAWLSRHVYTDVLATAGVFDYMGVRVLPSSPGVRALFLGIAVLPALWLPVHLRAPSDLVQLFLYYAVHVQTAALMPIVSYSSTHDQLVFCAMMTAGLLALDLRFLLPKLRAPAIRPAPHLFWLGAATWYLLAWAIFARSGFLTLENVELTDVYSRRADLIAGAAEGGKLFVYMASWTGAAFTPFIITAGAHTRRWWLVMLAVAIGFASFVVSSNKANYMAIPAVLGGYYFLRLTKGRQLATAMGVAFSALTLAIVFLDLTLGVAVGAGRAPVLTWQVVYRTFANNGFLSAVYLDAFQDLPFAYYADSFLRWIPGPRLPAPVPLLAGATYTDVTGNWANAHLWADSYANLGYLGMGISAAFTGLVFWVYDGLVSDMSRVMATAALIVPATVIANTATQTALTSNGLLFIFLLVYAWPRAVPRLRTSAPTSEAVAGR